MRSLATLPTALFIVAAPRDGVVYGHVYGPFARRALARRAVRDLNRYARRESTGDPWRVLRADVTWKEDEAP